MKEKILLGIVKKDIKESQTYNPKKDSVYILGEKIYLTKHSWDCNWYWGFGYIVNKDLHCHAKVFIEEFLWHNLEEVFESSIFKSNKEFWVFKDLLKQAYSLQNTAEVYRHGGHCTTLKGTTDIIQSKEKEEMINTDLNIVLNKLWSFLNNLKNKRG